MTRKEYERRENAVRYAFVDKNQDKAFDFILQIMDINANDIVFRFRPPREYEIDTLKEKKIFLCRPWIYKDTGDCGVIFDMVSLYRYLMLEMKPEKYGKYKGMLNKEMDEVMQQAIKAHPKYKEICDAIRNEALVACISQSYSEYMWKNYAEDSEGICLVYNLRQLLLKKPDKLIIYPVRYVDDRKKCKDIIFNASDYGMGDECYENEHRKYILSCVTKDKIPYSQEAEWRIFKDYDDLTTGEKGKKFDFDVKPIAIIMGKNIDRNPAFKQKVMDYSKDCNVKLLQEGQNSFDANK